MANYFLKVDKDLFKLGLNPTQILILAQIMEFDTNTGDCFISDKTLADNFGVSESTIKREVKNLETLGYISRETKNIKGGRERHIKVNHTRLNLTLVENNKAQNDTCTKLNLTLDKGQNDTIKDNINKIIEIDNNSGVILPTAEVTPLAIEEVKEEEGTIENPKRVAVEWLREQYKNNPNAWLTCCASKLVLHKPTGLYYKRID